MCGVLGIAIASRLTPTGDRISTDETRSTVGVSLLAIRPLQPAAKALANRFALAPAANCITP
ncbi:hypothetical protein PkoCFBP13504_14115 [Pseudomonas koreensis]|nr:hypothetical protein PkoCFBP13504_14115 [Pseudomonas koreensis]